MTTSSVISLDGHKYAVIQGAYSRVWRRFFSVNALAHLVTATFIDRGPGLNVYTISLLVTDFDTDSVPYALGVTESWNTQKTNLENAFAKISTGIVFIDPFGKYPKTSGTNNKIYFTQFSESVLPQSTPSTPYIKYDIELTEAVGVIIS